MKLTIDDNTVIYVAAPAKLATGGPELLHQLAYHLRVDLGYKAYMYYWPENLNDPVPPEYKGYGNPFVRKIVDSENNILIVPEIVSGIRILSYFTNIRKIIWWLSVDNFIISYLFQRYLRTYPLKYIYIHIFRLMNKVARRIFGIDVVDVTTMMQKFWDKKTVVLDAFQELNVRQADLHLCQSYYAMNFLRTFSINNVAYLSDYLNKDFLNEDFEINRKSNLVVFNPKKGAVAFTRKVMKFLPGVNFVPLQNMTRSEVVNLLKRAKVYTDFGIHPGKDRPPREAALLGCCVIVSERGSAANGFDVPIPNKYKFKMDERDIPQIVGTINHCLNNYEVVYHDFDKYREVIKNEPDRFLKDLFAIFGKSTRV